ncbi:hypothetical protein XH80_24230 [Bradyrhizobium sp. CCBAU 45384]|nr:hypothetical protein [Bradyrhizobium sp. CCBAU 45384]
MDKNRAPAAAFDATAYLRRGTGFAVPTVIPTITFAASLTMTRLPGRARMGGTDPIVIESRDDLKSEFRYSVGLFNRWLGLASGGLGLC